MIRRVIASSVWQHLGKRGAVIKGVPDCQVSHFKIGNSVFQPFGGKKTNRYFFSDDKNNSNRPEKDGKN